MICWKLTAVKAHSKGCLYLREQGYQANHTHRPVYKCRPNDPTYSEFQSVPAPTGTWPVQRPAVMALRTSEPELDVKAIKAAEVRMLQTMKAPKATPSKKQTSFDSSPRPKADPMEHVDSELSSAVGLVRAGFCLCYDKKQKTRA